MYRFFQKIKDVLLKNRRAVKSLLLVFAVLTFFNLLFMFGAESASQLNAVYLENGERFGSGVTFIKGGLAVGVLKDGVSEVVVHPIMHEAVSPRHTATLGGEVVSKSIDLRENDSNTGESFVFKDILSSNETTSETYLNNLALPASTSETLEYMGGNNYSLVNGGVDDLSYNFSVLSVGDINGDGNEDLIIGDPSEGRVIIHFLNDSYSTIDAIEIVGEVGFGYSVALVKDIDGDGLDDLIIGNAYSGVVKVIGLLPDFSVNDIFTLEGSYSSFGSSLDSFVKGDETYLAVGAPDDEVVVVYKALDVGFREVSRVFLSAYKNDLMTGSGFGRSVAFVDGLDSGGNLSLLVGAPYYEIGGVETGAVFVQKFKDSLDGVEDLRILSNDLNLIPFSEYGASIATIGDVDGDGVVDLAIGSPGVGDGDGKSIGSVYVYPGGDIDLDAPLVTSVDYSLNKVSLLFNERVFQVGEGLVADDFVVKRKPYGLEKTVLLKVNSIEVEESMLHIETDDYFLLNDGIWIDYVKRGEGGLSDISGNMVGSFQLVNSVESKVDREKEGVSKESNEMSLLEGGLFVSDSRNYLLKSTFNVGGVSLLAWGSWVGYG